MIQSLINPKGMIFVGRVDVVGANVTTMSISSNIKMTADKSYIVEYQIISDNVNAGINFFVNGLTTATNYYTEQVRFDGATVAAARQNATQIHYSGAGNPDYSTGTFKMNILNVNNFIVYGFSCDYQATANQNRFYQTQIINKTDAITSVNSISFIHTGGAKIMAGSYIKVWEVQS